MKILLYIGLLLLVCFLPVQGTDVGELIPVEVIAVSESDGMVTVRTDTGEQGSGSTLQTAFEDLKNTTAGVIYLDTAEYVLLEPGNEEWIPVLRKYLKEDTKVCEAEENIGIDVIANYLSVHHPGICLKDAEEVERMPVIVVQSGRYRME